MVEAILVNQHLFFENSEFQEELMKRVYCTECSCGCKISVRLPIPIAEIKCPRCWNMTSIKEFAAWRTKELLPEEIYESFEEGEIEDYNIIKEGNYEEEKKIDPKGFLQPLGATLQEMMDKLIEIDERKYKPAWKK